MPAGQAKECRCFQAPSRYMQGPGLIKRGSDESDKELKMIFDLDVSMSGKVPVNLAAASMQTVHAQAGSIFRDAITDTLHDAMEPKG